MWSAKFGKNGNEYKAILQTMHTSLYETVSRKYGLERGDSVEGRNVRHLDKHEFYREQLKLEKAIKGLTTMKENLESSITRLQDEIQTVHARLSDRKIHDITEDNSNLNETLSELLDVLAIPDFREMFFSIADALIGGRPISTSSGGGGDTSNLRWDGRNPDEDEQSYMRRCIMAAAGVVISRSNQRGVRR